MAKRSPYSSGKALKKQRNERNIKIGVGAAVLFVFLVGCSLVLRMDAITISKVSFEGLTVLTENDIRPLVESQLGSAYGFFIPKRNTFLYPKQSIEQELAHTLKRIKHVDVHRESLTELVVSIEERKPIAQWCRSESCYFIDEGGYVFAESPLYSGDVYFRYEGVIEDENPVGQQYLTPEEFRTLGLFISSLENVGFKTISLTLAQDEYSLGLPGGGKIIFVRGTSLDQVLAAAEATLTSDAFTGKDLTTLEYIDLRFPNKVVYKWR